jgi:FkbM family methyltransferase
MPVFLPSLKRNGLLDQIQITVCNVGSRKVNDGDDYAKSGWEIFAPNLTIYGFDADADACEAANAELARRSITWKEQHIPLALSHSIGESTLYVTRNPMCSSLYPPNEPFMERFQDLLVELAGLDFTVEIETTTLDNFCAETEIEAIDFLQIDVQGADLHVLEGASEMLKTVLGVQIEVEFSPLYVNQPLFSDVDTYLRSHDFSLFNIHPARLPRRQAPVVSRAHPGQLLWGEAFYFCDLLQPAEMLHAKTPQQMFKLACIADVMNFPDYTLEILEYLTLNYGGDPVYNFTDSITETLTAVSELSESEFSTHSIVANLRNYASDPVV